jgi:hypothetical protein
MKTQQQPIRRKFIMVPNTVVSAATSATKFYCPVSLPAAPWEAESKPPRVLFSKKRKGHIAGRYYEEGEFPC